MKLENIPGAIAELNLLAQNPALDHNSPAVMASNVYQIIQTAANLDASYLPDNLTPNAFLLLAKIAANSPIRTLNIACNHLYTLDHDYIIALATIIATSKTIHTLDIKRNFLGEHIFAFIETIMQSSALKFIDIRWNSLQHPKKNHVKELIQDHNKEVLEWQKALEHLNAAVGRSLDIEGEVTSVIGEVAFLTNDNLLNGNTIQYVIDDSCVII